MENQRLSNNLKLALSFVSIVGLLIFSSVLANTVQGNSAKRVSATLGQNELNFLIVSIKADIAESMLPAHDYLIEPNPKEEPEFEEALVKIKRKFTKLSSTRHFEAVDRRLIKEALSQFQSLESIQKEIFALRGAEIDRDGAEKMEHMHDYQHEILKNLEKLSVHEKNELSNFLKNEQVSSRRSIVLIAAAAALALGAALLVGYLSGPGHDT